jgi:hypothetical protein
MAASYDSDSTIAYGYDSDPEYGIQEPTKSLPWWERKEGDTPDSTKLHCVKTWIVERRGTNTSPSMMENVHQVKATQTALQPAFEEPISITNLDAALDSLNLYEDVNTDYEVAAINSGASLNTAKVWLGRAEKELRRRVRKEKEMQRINSKLSSIIQRRSCKKVTAMKSSSTST